MLSYTLKKEKLYPGKAPMIHRLEKNRSWQKVLCLFVAAAFLILLFSCAHPSENSKISRGAGGRSTVGEAGTAGSYSSEDPWWKKPEYEWLIVTLIVIGAGIAAGAAIMISSGGGGLSVHVQK
jgi:hypothetical protein